MRRPGRVGWGGWASGQMRRCRAATDSVLTRWSRRHYRVIRWRVRRREAEAAPTVTNGPSTNTSCIWPTCALMVRRLDAMLAGAAPGSLRSWPRSDDRLPVDLRKPAVWRTRRSGRPPAPADRDRMAKDGAPRGVQLVLRLHDVPAPRAPRFLPCVPHRGTAPPPRLARANRTVNGLNP